MTTNLKELWQSTVKSLKKAGVEAPETEARWILRNLFGLSEAQIIANTPSSISDSAVQKLSEAIERRSEGEPLAYILGEQEFYGYSFIVTKDVLIPRADTESLVRWALKAIKNLSSPWVLDIGAGSGCLGLAVAKENNNVHLTSLDISTAALEVAKQNAVRLGVAARAEFWSVDANSKKEMQKVLRDSQFDLIVANPPYLDRQDPEVDSSVTRYEPHGALFSEESGLRHIRIWMENALPYLKPKGFMVFEIGYRQAEDARRIFSTAREFKSIYIEKDLAGRDRMVCAQKGS